MRRFYFSIALALMAFAAFSSTLPAGPLIIDTFESPTPAAFYSFGSANPFSNTVTGAPGVLGGSRNYTATQVSGATFSLGTAGAIGTDASLGSADKGAVQFFSGSVAVEGILRYPATGTFGSPQNFLATGDRFEFDFQFVDGGIGLGAGELLETLIEVTTTTGTRTLLVNFKDSVGPVSYSVPFSSFGGSGSFASVTSLKVTLNDPDPQTDFQLNKLSVAEVPEPASVAVFGVILIGGAFYGWRRRNRTAYG